MFCRTSSQDGGIGRYTLPPHTTKRTTTNLKTQNNHNCQKIELYGSLTTKEFREQDRPCKPGFQGRELKPQHLTENTCGGWGGSRRNSQPHRWVHWRDPQGPGTYTSPPTWESAPEGPNLLVGSGESDWKLAESRASAIVPSRIPSPHTVSQCSDVSCPTLVNT